MEKDTFFNKNGSFDLMSAIRNDATIEMPSGHQIVGNSINRKILLIPLFGEAEFFAMNKVGLDQALKRLENMVHEDGYRLNGTSQENIVLASKAGYSIEIIRRGKIEFIKWKNGDYYSEDNFDMIGDAWASAISHMFNAMIKLDIKGAYLWNVTSYSDREKIVENFIEIISKEGFEIVEDIDIHKPSV